MPLFEIVKQHGSDPCGECRLAVGETCNICGATNWGEGGLAAVSGKGQWKTSEGKVLRVCPMRDAICPHGLTCPFVGEGLFGYPCKEGWRNHP